MKVDHLLGYRKVSDDEINCALLHILAFLNDTSSCTWLLTEAKSLQKTLVSGNVSKKRVFRLDFAFSIENTVGFKKFWTKPFCFDIFQQCHTVRTYLYAILFEIIRGLTRIMVTISVVIFSHKNSEVRFFFVVQKRLSSELLRVTSSLQLNSVKTAVFFYVFWEYFLSYQANQRSYINILNFPWKVFHNGILK